MVLLFVWLFQPQLAKWTGLEASAGFLYLIPVSLLLGALLSVAIQVAIREGLFKPKAIANVASTVSGEMLIAGIWETGVPLNTP